MYRMEVLSYLYAEPFHPFDPMVCFDESSIQLLADTKEPLPVEPGQPARFNYEYLRRRTCNLFVFFALHYGWRHVEVTP